MSAVLSRAGFRRMLLCGFLPASVLLAVLAALGLRGGIPLEVLTRDPLAVAGRPAYVGLLSNVGVLLWCAATSTCFFTSAVLGRSRHGTFLLCSGALSAVLMLDDLFMLHEDVFPKRLGISERRVIAAYGILAAAYLAAFARTILATRWHALPLTGACFGLSVAIDAGWLQPPGGVFAEDAAKFLGIAGWCAYLCSTCAAALRPPLLVARLRDLLLDAALADETERLDRGAAELAAACLGAAPASDEVAQWLSDVPLLDPGPRPSDDRDVETPTPSGAVRARSRPRPRPRRGAAIVYAVVVMSVLIGLCSLAVDYGKAQLVRSELQAAVDGAARAAASGLSTSVAEAKQRARDLSAMNRADGAAIALADADFRFGKWDAEANQIDTDGTPIDAVEVTARRTVSLPFGSMVGKSSTNVAAAATARHEPGASYKGFIGLSSITFWNNAFIGSYRSSVTTTPTEASSTGAAIISSNVVVEFHNNATVHGDVVLGPGGSVVKHSSLTVTGSTVNNPAPFTAPADPPWNGSATNPNGVAQAYTVDNNTSLPGGTYYFTSLTVNKRLTFTGPATLYVNGDITTEDEIVTYQDKPPNLKIYVLGNNRTIDLQGDINLYAEVQAPGAALVANNKLFLYGKGMYRSIESKNNAEFYFDEDTASGSGAGGITLVQ